MARFKTMAVSLRPQLLDKIKEIARHEERPLSNLITVLIKKKIAEYEANERAERLPQRD